MGRRTGVVVHKWTEEEKEYLKKVCKGKSRKEIAKIMTKKFNIEFTEKQIIGALKRYGLTTGRIATFPKGHTPWNKGLKGINHGGKETQFKKGHMPLNHKPIGSERVNVEGYTEIKVKEPRTWKLKHRVIIEERYGKLPKDKIVIFADGDKSNLDINNLLIITRKQQVIMNKYGLVKNDAELTKTGVIIADIIMKINERSKA